MIFITNILKFVAIIIVFLLAPISFLIIFLIANSEYRKEKNHNKDCNIFHILDDYFEITKKLIKKLTKLDFFDWINLILFLSGIILIASFRYFYKISYEQLLTAIILWFTGIAILQYTKETYWLKQLQQKDLKLQREHLKFERAPFVIIHFEKPETFILKNVGKGVARNVRWEVRGEKFIYPRKTVISPNEGSTWIRNEGYRKFNPAESNKPYEIIIVYEDLSGIKYYTRLKSGETVDDYEVLNYSEYFKN